jgi:serine phosphatase RsbU (regulator of sigma subunit)/PAS domain-containing protein/ligand-binding sensor domain-containing protein
MIKNIPMRICLLAIYVTFSVLNFGQVNSSLVPFTAHFEEENIRQIPLEFQRKVVGKVNWKNVTANNFQSITTTDIQLWQSDEQPFFAIDTSFSKPTIIQLKHPTLIKRTGFKLPDYRSVNLKYLNSSCGLPSNEIIDMSQDEDGNIWVLSGEGIFKITGSYVFHYNHQQLLPHANLEKIHCHNNKVYIATFGQGLWVLEGNNLSVYSKENGFFSNHILNFDQSDNQIFITYYGTGWIELTPSGLFVHYMPDTSSQDILLQTKHTHLGRLFISDKGSAYLFNSNHASYRKLNFGTLSWLANSQLVAGNNLCYVLIPQKGILLIKDTVATLLENDFLRAIDVLYLGKSGICWGFSSKGIVLLAGDKIYRMYTHESFLSETTVVNCFQDDVSNLWLSTTNKGLGFISPSNFSMVDHLGGSISLRTLYSHQGNIYAELGGGGIQWMTKDGQINEYSHPALSNIVGITTYNNGLYIATTKGFYELLDGNLYEIIFTRDRGLNTHTSLCASATGVYIGNYNYGVLHFDGSKYWEYTNFSSEVNQVVVDGSTQIVWIANADKGLSYIKDNSVFHCSSEQGFLSNTVYSIAHGDAGHVFIGTSIGLVALMDNQFYHLPSIGSFQGKVTSCLYEPSRKEIWINTSTQLFKLLPEKNFQIIRYSQNEIPAFGNIPCNGMFVDGEDILFIMDNHVVRYIDFIFGYQKKELIIDVVSIKIRNTHTNLQQELTIGDLTPTIVPANSWQMNLGAGYYDLHFILDVKNFGKEEGLTYYYRLNGWSDQWEGPVSNDVINFNNLPPGKYTLHIKAETTDEIVVQPVQITFQIDTFFYQTTWFVLVVFFVGSLLILFLLKTYSQFDFRNFESYTSLREIIIKLRLLGIFSIVLLPSFEFIGSVYFNLFPFNGSTLTLVVVISAIGLTISFLSVISQRVATYFLMFAYTLVLSVYITRGHSEGFPIGITIQTVVILLFAKLVFAELRTFVNFIGVFVLIHIANAFLFTIHYSDNSLLYYWPTFQTILLLLALYLVDVNAKRSVLFSNKILESSELFVLVCDEKGKIIYCNDYLKNTTQQKETDLLGFGWWEYRGYDTIRLKETIQQITQLIKTESTSNYVNSLLINDEFMYVEWNDYVLEGRYLIGVGKNITKEHVLRLQNEQLSLVAKSVTNGVLITNSDHIMEWCNTGFETIFETSLAQIKNASIQLLLKSDEENNDQNYEVEYITPSGKSKWLLINKSSTLKKGMPNGFIHVITDISIRKNLELKLVDYTEDLEINNLLKEQLIYSNDFEQLANVSLKNLIDKLPSVTSGSLLFLNNNKLDFKVYSLENSVISQRSVLVDDIKGYAYLKNQEAFIEKNLLEVPLHERSKSDDIIMNETQVIAYIEVPITYNNELLGALILGFDIPYPFKERQENILKSYAKLLSVAIQKIKIQADLANKNKDITDSLFYAKNIQNSLLPHLEEVRPFFHDLFVYYQPKDIVSGDFYWIEKVNDQLILVVGDCTGHGVPGAFITLLGQNLLNQYISEHKDVVPEQVISFINERTFQALNKGKDTYIKDGMELAVCVFNTQTKLFSYAGVGIELTYFADNVRNTIEAPRLMVGELSTSPTMSLHTMHIDTTTKFYISTDGFRDQLGGEPRKRFGKPAFYATLDEFKNLPLFQQPFLLNHKLQLHKGQHEQTDDILVIGFEL